MTPDQPISLREFRSWFYSCDTPRKIHGLFHVCKSPCSNNELLSLIPQRKTELDVNDDRRETFYGLYAQEVPRILTPLIYSLLLLTPSILFFFLWLLGWGHVSDLQNAVVPFSISFGFLPVLWGLILTHVKGEAALSASQDSQEAVAR